jgi:uncharacterized Zn-finger protein
VKANGSAHAPTFSCHVSIIDLVSSGSSKKQAKNDAALAMLDKLDKILPANEKTLVRLNKTVPASEDSQTRLDSMVQSNEKNQTKYSDYRNYVQSFKTDSNWSQ